MLHLLLFMAFTYYKTVTIAHTQCGASDSTDFPVTIYVTDADLKTVGNGGKVQNSSGYDIRPFSDSGLSIALTYELVATVYDPTTGTLEMHVKIPTVSHTSDTLFYLAFGDSGISTDGSSTATWDSHYLSVNHLPNGSSLNGADSTSNANTLTNNGGTATTGELDGGVAFDGGSTHYMLGANIINTSPVTLSCWVNVAAFPSFVGDDCMIATICEGNGGGTFDKSLYLIVGLTGVKFGFMVYDGSAEFLDGATTVPYSQWNYAVGTFAGSAEHIYANGAPDGSLAASSSFTGFSAPGLLVNGITGSKFGQAPAGSFDEVRLSNIARSDDWILTEYNNQKPSSTFLTFGVLTPVGGASTDTTWFQRRGFPLVNYRPTWINVP